MKLDNLLVMPEHLSFDGVDLAVVVEKLIVKIGRNHRTEPEGIISYVETPRCGAIVRFEVC